MKLSSIFLSMISVSVSEGGYERSDYLDDYNLKILEKEESNTKIISAYIDKKQNFICPGDQEFSLFMVYEQTDYEQTDYEQCNTGEGFLLHTCSESTWDTQQKPQVSERLKKLKLASIIGQNFQCNQNSDHGI